MWSSRRLPPSLGVLLSPLAAEHLFPVSAMTARALVVAAAALADRLQASDAPAAEDVAFTLMVGRDAMRERLAIVAPDVPTLAAALSAFAAAPDRRGPWIRCTTDDARTKVVLGDNAEDLDYLRALAASGRWAKLAALWAGGVDLAWDRLTEELPGRRVALPTYPLLGERHWIDDGLPPHPDPPARPRAGATPAPEPGLPAAAAPAAGSDERLTRVRSLLAATLGLPDAEAVPATASPAALGLDSMAALELRTRLDGAPSLAALLAAPTVAALSELLPHLPGARGDTATGLGASEPAPAPSAADRYEPFPVTDIQLAYLVGRQDGQALGGVGCQVYWEFERPRFDAARLAAAWNALVRRHDMLRAVFLPDARQRVLPPEEAGTVEVQLHDWSDLPPETLAARRDALAEAALEEAFDPARFPLFRLALSRGSGEDRLHFACDLLLADGPSLFLLMEEFAALYDDPAIELPALGAFCFRDYVLGVERRRDSTESAAARRYWEDRLDALPGAPALPTLPGPPATMRVRRLETVLPIAAWRAFAAEAAAHAGVTPVVAMLAAFAEAVAAWADRPAFCLNVTMAGRQPLHPEVYRLVGDFTSNVLLEVPERGDSDTFAAHAAALGRRLAADLENAAFSGVQAIGELARRRRGSVQMPVVFTALHGYAALLKRPAARLDAIGRYVRGATRTPQVLLDAQVLEAETGLHVSWDVVEDAFPPDLLADMFEGFAARVRRLAADPAAWTSTKAAIAPKPPEADMAARRAANRTAARLPREPIFAGILRQATADPARAAVVAPDRLVTFGALAAEGRRLAAALQAAGGVRPGDLVAVVMPKGWRQAVSVLAIGLCGAAYVPVEMPQPPARIRELLELAGPRLALLHEAPELGPCPCPAKAFDALLAGGWPDEPVPNAAEVGAEDLAYVVFTSGSTGTPKGVAMRHGAVSNTLHDINARFAIGPADRVLGVSSLSFDLSVWDLFGVLGAGGAAVLPMPEGLRDPSYLAALAGREGVTVWNSTPAYLKLVAGAPGVTLPSSLRLALLSGDWLPLPLARLLRERYPAVRLVSLGGATEAAIWSVFQPVERVEEGWLSVPYGLPLANQRLHVLDEALRHCPAGGAGQIHIGGAGLADGYWRDPERTSASFVRHPETGERLYRTGDWGRYLPGGAIEFLGRRDAQVKIGGHRIELPEVEAALLAVPGVTEAIALPVEDADGNQRLVAAYGHAGEAGEAIVRRSLAARLPPYMVPSSLLPCDRLPLTGNGKVDRRAIAARAAGGFGAAQPWCRSGAARPGSSRGDLTERAGSAGIGPAERRRVCPRRSAGGERIAARRNRATGLRRGGSGAAARSRRPSIRATARGVVRAERGAAPGLHASLRHRTGAAGHAGRASGGAARDVAGRWGAAPLSLRRVQLRRAGLRAGRWARLLRPRRGPLALRTRHASSRPARRVPGAARLAAHPGEPADGRGRGLHPAALRRPCRHPAALRRARVGSPARRGGRRGATLGGEGGRCRPRPLRGRLDGHGAARGGAAAFAGPPVPPCARRRPATGGDGERRGSAHRHRCRAPTGGEPACRWRTDRGARGLGGGARPRRFRRRFELLRGRGQLLPGRRAAEPARRCGRASAFGDGPLPPSDRRGARAAPRRGLGRGSAARRSGGKRRTRRRQGAGGSDSGPGRRRFHRRSSNSPHRRPPEWRGHTALSRGPCR